LVTPQLHISMVRKKILLTSLLVVYCSLLFAQQSIRFVSFKDKNGTPFSLQRPQEFLSQKSIDRRTKQKINLSAMDLPVNPTYLTSIRNAGGKVFYTSRWLNGAVVQATDAAFSQISQLNFVQGSRLLSNRTSIGDVAPAQSFSLPATNVGSPILNYGNATTQNAMLGINEMHSQNFTGRGMTIAVFDGGFTNVNNIKAAVYSRMSIAGGYNFVRGNNFVFQDDSHGSEVLSVMAGYVPNQFIGGAFDATYYLFVTEDVNQENPIEEAFWLVAAERADSLGVDIINSSLGYNTFDLTNLNYTQKDLNGRTSLISQAATCAARTGMLVVSSMGNFYSPEPFWTKMRMPADADSIISVGAVNAAEEYVSLSLQGYTEDNRVKPDAAAMGLATFYLTVNGNVSAGSGTSYAAPLVASLAAGIWQANPQMTNMQVLQAIRRAGSRFNNPNTQLGYGIPTFRRAMNILGVDEELGTQTNIYPTILASDYTVFCQFPAELRQTTFSYQLTDVTGKIHYQADNQLVDSEIINLKVTNKPLPVGIYFLNIHINNKTIYRKIISCQ
jgi:hypothetical protein